MFVGRSMYAELQARKNSSQQGMFEHSCSFIWMPEYSKRFWLQQLGLLACFYGLLAVFSSAMTFFFRLVYRAVQYQVLVL